ncbi:hypothetical protein [Nocardia sp. NPDC127526]|uniref:hypothetical protein n=1 Tax=Nocardia sp. NPDC127526 TaxID=3345393 RepID=UPI0036455B44
MSIESERAKNKHTQADSPADTQATDPSTPIVTDRTAPTSPNPAVPGAESWSPQDAQQRQSREAESWSSQDPRQRQSRDAEPGSGEGGRRIVPPTPEQRTTPETDSHDTGRPESAAPERNRLFAEKDLRQLREQWREVQTQFVDDPQNCVAHADELVGDAIRQLADTCAQRRQAIERRWHQGERADTEDLRQALRGYRDLFDQLLATASGPANG